MVRCVADDATPAKLLYCLAQGNETKNEFNDSRGNVWDDLQNEFETQLVN